VNASIQPATIAGRISGSVTLRNALAGIAAEVHRRLFQGRIERAKPRLHHHGDEAHGQRGVGDGDGQKPRSASSATKQQQQRKPVMTSGITSGA